MIAKHIERKASSRFSRLAGYIANTSMRALANYAADKDQQHEKLEALWIENCDAGDSLPDLSLAIAEIEATQRQNTRAQSDRTYHLLLSFQEGERPSDDALRAIEKRFAESLGFADHQRIIAAHGNTDNFHLHVAINKIHPTRLTLHEPFRDFHALARTCRAIEAEHGLAPNPVKDKDSALASAKAVDYEAHTHQQSFHRWIEARKLALIEAGRGAKTWQDFHEALESFGLQIKPRANGLVVGDGRHHVKASSIDRIWSKASLEKRFGLFQKPTTEEKEKERKASYRHGQPLMRLDRRHRRLWRRFLSLRRHAETLGYMPSWKSFLRGELTTDPLAMVLIVAQRRMVGMLTLEKTRQKSQSRKPSTQLVQKKTRASPRAKPSLHN